VSRPRGILIVDGALHVLGRRTPLEVHAGRRAGSRRRRWGLVAKPVGISIDEMRDDPRAKSDGSAVWTLLAISFAYGISTPTGPGHGKAGDLVLLVAKGRPPGAHVRRCVGDAAGVVAVVLVGICGVAIECDRENDVRGEGATSSQATFLSRS